MKKALLVITLILSLSYPALAEPDQFLPVWTALEAGMPGVALRELRKMEDPERGKTLYWYYLGTACREAGKYEESVEAFTKGLTFGTSGGILDGLGLTYARMGEHGKAMEYLQRAVDEEPTNFKYHNDLGAAYMSGEEPDKAIAEFVVAYKLSRSPESIKRIAFACGRKGNFEIAKKLLLVEFPLDEVYSLLSVIYEINGERDKAKEMHEMSLIVNNRHVSPANNLRKAAGETSQ